MAICSLLSIRLEHLSPVVLLLLSPRDSLSILVSRDIATSHISGEVILIDYVLGGVMLSVYNEWLLHYHWLLEIDLQRGTCCIFCVVIMTQLLIVRICDVYMVVMVVFQIFAVINVDWLTRTHLCYFRSSKEIFVVVGFYPCE